MLRFTYIQTPIILGITALFFSACLSWKSDRLVDQIKQMPTADAIRLFDKKEFPAWVYEPLKVLLNKASSHESVDNQAVIELLNLYIKRRPLDANGWLIASQFYQRLNQYDLASNALSVAHRLSETNMPTLFKVFNRYLELNLIEQAFPVAHDIVYARPNEFRRLFYLMSRLSDDYDQLIQEMIPKTVHQDKQFKLNIYYEWALIDAVKVNNLSLSQSVWRQMPQEFKGNNEASLYYIDYLVRFQDVSLIEPVWFDVVGKQIKLNEIIDFEKESLSPCWQIKEVDGAESFVETIPGRNRLLKVKFSGDKNLVYNHMSCIVLVESGASYNLFARSKGDDITTLSGPFIDVVFPGVNSNKIKNESLIGSWPWTEFDISFDVPESVSFARIRVRRDHTEFLDSKISGSVQFEILNLEKQLDVTQ